MAFEFCRDDSQPREHLHADLCRVPRRKPGLAIGLPLAVLLLSLAVLGKAAVCQTPTDDPGANNPPAPATDNSNDSPRSIPAGPAIVVQGVVKNAATGDPLPRVLVQAGGETGPGALTDGDGRFELTVSGLGPQIFQLTKPGFRDLPLNASGSQVLLENSNSVTHNVFVAEGMPSLAFAMTPTGVIRGKIDLSTGDPAQGIGVLLLRRTLQGGHGIWRVTANTRTNSDGAFRFASLDDGSYAIGTESARESELAGTLVEKESEGKVSWNGYAATFYPDAREFSAAARLHLRAGETVQANFALKLEPFHMVRATIAMPNSGDKSVVDYSASLIDSQGHSLSYPAQYDADSRTVQAMLPDGTYTLQVTAVRRPNLGVITLNHNLTNAGTVLQGTAEFTVSGRPVTGIRIAIAQKVSNPISVTVIHNSAQSGSPRGNSPGVFVSASQAGDTLVDGMWTQFAQGVVPGQLETNVLAPGSYWVHTSIGQPGLCESSFTAGGASLATQPFAVGAGGATAPLALALRDDCASLKLNLPPNLMSPAAGEEPAFTVYVVPDFDSTVDVAPFTLRPSTGGSFTLENLTPGSYHIYPFETPVELEYHNPEALASLPAPGQTVILEPSSTRTIVLEAPAH